jgi:2-polyprenyl-6-methoxyphenol hydroxylase-like FAD-dependent oxidoreductase
MPSQRIAIIGAGTAGLAAAIFLARQNHHITLIERAPELAPVGAGLMLQPTGLSVLSALGVRDEIERYGARIDVLHGTTVSGRTVMNTHYAHLDANLYGIGIHRASLCHALDTALSGVPHQRWMGTQVEAVAERGNEVIVDFLRNGAREHAAFDAVLIANGSASTLRPPELVKYDRQYPWGALWTMLPQTPELDQPTLQQRYDSSHTMIGLLPTGSTPQQPDQPLLSFFWSLPVSEMATWPLTPAQFDAWKQNVISLWPRAATALAPLNNPKQLIPATYRDVIMKRWGSGRIGVIGDAAHAMSPQLGQGANMALMDAHAMANAINNNNSWDAIWMDYHRQREGAIRFYQSMSRLLTPVFQSRIPGVGLFRDIGFPVMNQVPWLRKEMARVVSGLKDGYV